MIIPAHNEQAVIGRCLDSLLEHSAPGELEVIVVCNGCNDGTASLARARSGVTAVIELPYPSKTAALNSGDSVASCFPRIYLDADVTLSTDAVRALVEELLEVPCAAPRVTFDLAGRSWTVKAFYEVWSKLPYITVNMVGSGVVALSAEGRSRFAAFPDYIADDQFMMNQFAPDERTSLSNVEFTVYPPYVLRDLLRVRARVYRGNRQLSREGPRSTRTRLSSVRSLLLLATRPGMRRKAGAYAFVSLLGLCLSFLPTSDWGRDDSSRRVPDGRSSGSLADEQLPAQAAALAYVVSRYPSLSHTFIRSEVALLRAEGFGVTTISVRQVREADPLSGPDRAELATTISILPRRVGSILASHWRALRRSPGSYVQTLRLAVSGSPPGGRRHLWQLFYFVEALVLWDICDRRGITWAHAHFANVGADLAWLASDFGQRANPDSGWGWSFTMHGPTELFDTVGFNLRRKVGSAALVVCISHYCAAQLMTLCPREDWPKLQVIGCGVDASVFAPGQSCDGSSRGQRPSARTRLLFLGRLVPEKGLTVLLEAVERLLGDGVALDLTVGGGGPQRRDYERLAERRGLGEVVTFLGPVDHAEVPALLRGHDVFCLPSFAEGVPIVLMEAMASVLPVVTTSIAGIPELVDHGVAGLLVPPGNVTALSDALGSLARSPEMRARMGASGRSHVVGTRDARASARAVADAISLARGLDTSAGDAEGAPIPATLVRSRSGRRAKLDRR